MLLSQFCHYFFCWARFAHVLIFFPLRKVAEAYVKSCTLNTLRSAFKSISGYWELQYKLLFCSLCWQAYKKLHFSSCFLRVISQNNVQICPVFNILLYWPLDGVDIVKISGEEMDGAETSSLQWPPTSFLPFKKPNQTRKSSSIQS